MKLLLRCGCVVPFREGVVSSEDGGVLCGQHGRQAVARTVGMPPPRIRGVCTGPHVTPADLGEWKGPLPGLEQRES